MFDLCKMKHLWLLVLHRPHPCWPWPQAEDLNLGAPRSPLLGRTWALEALWRCSLVLRSVSCTGESDDNHNLLMPSHTCLLSMKHGDSLCWKKRASDKTKCLNKDLWGGDETHSCRYCSLCIYRYLFKVQNASHGRSQEGEARKLLARAPSNYSVPSLMCL